MSRLTDRISYLQGLAEGMKLNPFFVPNSTPFLTLPFIPFVNVNLCG